MPLISPVLNEGKIYHVSSEKIEVKNLQTILTREKEKERKGFLLIKFTTCFLAQAVSLMFPLLTAIPISATRVSAIRGGKGGGGLGVILNKVKGRGSAPRYNL